MKHSSEQILDCLRFDVAVRVENFFGNPTAMRQAWRGWQGFENLTNALKRSSRAGS